MINDLANQIHEACKAKGYYKRKRNIGEVLCLIHSEVSEALEADRKNRYAVMPAKRILEHFEDKDVVGIYEFEIKGRFEEEMADILIRVLDLCAYKNIDIEGHVKAKMRYNKLKEADKQKKY